jgi:hypothetical protein
MSRSFNPCRKHREDICLLASGVLTGSESAGLENHFTTCAGCRKYHSEMRALIAPLQDWEKNLLTPEPVPAAQARWSKDFAAATAPSRSGSLPLVRRFHAWCLDMFWPQRRAWAGLVAIWLAVAIVNISFRDPALSATVKSGRPSPELVRAFLVHEGLIAVDHSSKKGIPETLAPRSERRRPGSGV